EPARAHLDDRRRPTLLDDERQRTHAGTSLGVVLARWRKTHGQQCAGAAVLRTARARLPDPAYAAVRLQEREEFTVVVRRPSRRLPSRPLDRHAHAGDPAAPSLFEQQPRAIAELVVPAFLAQQKYHLVDDDRAAAFLRFPFVSPEPLFDGTAALLPLPQRDHRDLDDRGAAVLPLRQPNGFHDHYLSAPVAILEPGSRHHHRISVLLQREAPDLGHHVRLPQHLLPQRLGQRSGNLPPVRVPVLGIPGQAPRRLHVGSVARYRRLGADRPQPLPQA